MNVCSKDGLCQPLKSLIEHDETKPGFHMWQKVEGGTLVTKGVLLKPKDKDRKLMALNRCPFCEQSLHFDESAFPSEVSVLLDRVDELHAALTEARKWIGDGPLSDGLDREYWTPEYIAAVDMVDDVLGPNSKCSSA